MHLQEHTPSFNTRNVNHWRTTRTHTTTVWNPSGSGLSLREREIESCHVGSLIDLVSKSKQGKSSKLVKSSQQVKHERLKYKYRYTWIYL